jgi:polyisoprenoid-binding protein YceI
MAVTKWKIDPAHSEIQFKVKHLMITAVTGHFMEKDATVEAMEPDFSDASIYFEAKTASINTNDEKRDAHLRSADFFESEKYPLMKFQSTAIEKAEDPGTYKVTGNLTIRDITKPVTVTVEFGGMQKDPWGTEKAGFSVDGKINRKDWGLNWNAPLEAGGVLVSDEVSIFCEIQLSRVE